MGYLNSTGNEVDDICKNNTAMGMSDIEKFEFFCIHHPVKFKECMDKILEDSKNKPTFKNQNNRSCQSEVCDSACSKHHTCGFSHIVTLLD